MLLQYNDNVVGPGNPKYNDAYFEISYLRTYTTVTPGATTTSVMADPDSSPTGSTTSTGTGSLGSGATITAVADPQASKSSAARQSLPAASLATNLIQIMLVLGVAWLSGAALLW